MKPARDRTSERFYRLLDGIYRLHDDLYYIEDAVLRSTSAQVRLSQISAQSRLGAAIAAVVVGVPVLISVSPLDWSSAPAFVIGVAGLLFIAFLIWQVKEANKAVDALELAERLTENTPLARRVDYQLERINANAHRLRVVEEIIEDLDSHLAGEKAPDFDELKRRRGRYAEIRAECVSSIAKIVKESHSMVLADSRTESEHAAILDWARPYLSEEELR